MGSCRGNRSAGRAGLASWFGRDASGQCCFGVEPCKDGSFVVVSEDGEAAGVRHFRAEQAATVVQFVREKSRAPRVCIASTGGHALRLALAFGELPQAEVILLRPAALPRRCEAMDAEQEMEAALALARYARRAA